MVQDVLQTPIDYLKGVGPNRASLLRSELGIHTFQDLIHLFPNRYIDRTQFYKLNALEQNNAEVQVIGQITEIREVGQQRGKRLVATFRDSTGKIDLVWFRGQKWIKERLKLHTDYVVFGKTNLFNGVFNMPHPDMELKTDFDKSLSSAIQPIYPSTEKLSNRGISNRSLSKLVEHLFQHVGNSFDESLSDEILMHNGLISKKDALNQHPFS
jgi:ATP-dependent DNA helicase RecG